MRALAIVAASKSATVYGSVSDCATPSGPSSKVGASSAQAEGVCFGYEWRTIRATRASLNCRRRSSPLQDKMTNLGDWERGYQENFHAIQDGGSRRNSPFQLARAN